MRISVQLVVCDEDGHEATFTDVAILANACPRIDQLPEAKPILAALCGWRKRWHTRPDPQVFNALTLKGREAFWLTPSYESHSGSILDLPSYPFTSDLPCDRLSLSQRHAGVTSLGHPSHFSTLCVCFVHQVLSWYHSNLCRVL
jgi:hypothetical protein